MKHACLVGSNISHSRSPMIHGYWINQLGLDADYTLRDIDVAELPAVVADVRAGKLAGCNVTVPHKQAIAGLLDGVDDVARATGSVNTVYRIDSRVLGTSTDGMGYLAHLLQTWPDFQPAGSRVLVLGAGGAALSIVAALLAEGVSRIFVSNRTSERVTPVTALAPEIIEYVAMPDLPHAASQADLVINTTSLGTGGKGEYDFPMHLTPARCIISDIVYVPLKTPMLVRAEQLNRRTLDGLGMLLHQAVEGFRLWFGVKPEVTAELRVLIERDIEANV